MQTYSLSDTAGVGAHLAAASRTQALWDWLRLSGAGVAASAAWIAFGLSCLLWDDLGDWSRTYSLGIGAFVVGAVALFGTLSTDYLGRAGSALRHRAPYVIGAALGFVTGVSIGWSRGVGYWVHPVLRFIGPLPATAWLPIAFFTFPSSWSASTFLIALATGFPVTVLTWSGVASVSNAFYDVARTLGAKPSFLVLKVAIPAALPHVFVGLFMGLGSSFAVLVVAEMIGVKAGLGWYLQWAQGWAAYANMYAALIVMSLLCSGAITLLFRTRDHLLVWQKGVVKW